MTTENAFTVKGILRVRTGTSTEWADDTQKFKGANFVLKKGEIGWELNTSLFKVGDGVRSYRDLSYILPDAKYAMMLGSEKGSFTYQEVVEELAKIDSRLNSLEDKVQWATATLDRTIEGNSKTLYVDSENLDMYIWSEISKNYVRLTNNTGVIKASLR